MLLSTLTFEPYDMPAPEDCELGGGRLIGREHYFCRLHLDGKLFAEHATLFTASDEVIERYANLCFPFFRDGSGHIFVRRISDYVVWFVTQIDPQKYYWFLPGLREDELYFFDAAHYTRTIGAGSAEQLPEFSSSELQFALQQNFPDAEITLYSTPPIPNDLLGRKWVRRVQEILQSKNPSLQVVPPPATWTEYHIGLDTREFAECIWRVGRNEQGIAVQFMAHPYFPLWVGGEAIQAAFTSL